MAPFMSFPAAIPLLSQVETKAFPLFWSIVMSSAPIRPLIIFSLYWPFILMVLKKPAYHRDLRVSITMTNRNISRIFFNKDFTNMKGQNSKIKQYVIFYKQYQNKMLMPLPKSIRNGIRKSFLKEFKFKIPEDISLKSEMIM